MSEVEAPIPPMPDTPPTWSNLPAYISYAGALALFVIGVLVSSGVVVPESVSHSVEMWAGIISQIAGVAVALVNNIANKSVQKTMIAHSQMPMGAKIV